MRWKIVFWAGLLFMLNAPRPHAQAPQRSCEQWSPWGYGDRNFLWHIVSACIDPDVANYCKTCSRPLVGHCSRAGQCDGRGATEVVSRTAEYIAIKDQKMCAGCSADFVHLLALPLSQVCGIEDPRRPDGIWPFAWDTAKRMIAEEQSVALTVSPPHRRTQDQLHIHIMRLLPDARRRLLALGSPPEEVSDLGGVWEAARRHAARDGIEGWYGIIAVRSATGPGFLVASTRGNPDHEFALYACR